MIRPHLTSKKFFLAIGLLFSAVSLFAADRYSVATGNWNSTATWSAISGGAPGASVPVAGDNVFLENGFTVTVTADAACSSITFTAVGASASLTVDATFTLTVSGTVTLYKLPNANSSCTVSGGGTLSCTTISVGSAVNSPTTNGTTRTHTFTSSVNTLNVSVNLEINSYYTNNNRIRNGIFNLTSGTLTVNSSIITSNANGSNTSTFSMATGAQSGTLILPGTTPFSLSGTGTNIITLNGTSSLVNYSRSGDQTIYGTTYTNVSITGSGNKTMQGNTTVSGNITLSSGTFTVGASTLILNGPAIGGTPSNLITSVSSSLVFGGTSAGVLIPTSVTALNGLSITNTNVVTLQSSPTISGTFNPAGAGLSIGANTMTLNGQINCGTLVGGASSNIVIGGAGSASLSAVTLNNLTINRAVSLCGNVTVGGTLTLTSGAFTVGAYTLTLNGPAIAGTPSNLATSSSSNLVFGGSSAGVLVPSSVTALNGLSITNTSVVTLQSSPTISGTFNPAGAGLSIGANTLTLNGQINCGTLVGGATSNMIIGGSGSASLSAVTLNNLNINRAVSLCGDVTVGGTLTLTSGTFSVGTYTLTLNGPAISGTPSNLATTSSSSLVFGGSSAGVLIPSSVANLNNLTINNPSGVTLTSSFTVAGTLTMTQGNIISSAYTLTLSGATLSYTSGTITGRLQRAVGSTGTQYLFPVGTASGYNPLKITFSNLTSGQLAVQFLPNDIGASGLPLNDAGTEIFDRQVTGYWTMTAVAPMASASYDVNLNYTGFTGVDALARIIKKTDGGSLTLDGTHGSVSSPEITRTGMNGISTTTTDLAIGKPDPRFITHPSDFTGCNATFSVTVSGKAPLTYQWQENNGGGFVNITDGGIYSGATTSTLTITGAPMSMNGYQYRCVVTDGLGYNNTSNSATLTVTVVTLGYSYTADITLDPASGSANLSDFPVLISITTSPDRDRLRTIANGGRLSSTNGYDVIFTDQNGSKLYHQIESYNAVTGEYIAWVRIPVLSYTSSTTIKMLYGNAAISSDPSVESVWASNYKGVWHLNSSDFTDATSNNNDGTQNATTSVAGRIAGGKDFNGTTSYIQVTTNGFVENDNNQTISIWANYSATPGGNRNLISFQNAGANSAIQLGFRGGDAVAWKWGGTILVNGGAAPSTDTWHYYVYTFDGTTSRIYIDGIEMNNSTVAPQTAMPSEGNIGRYNNGEYIDAILDEPRFSMSPKSAGWVLTEYNNQNNPAAFMTLGAENSNTLLGTVGVCITTYTLNQGYPSGGTYSGTGVSGTNFDASVAGVGTHSIMYTYTDAYGCTNNVSKDIIVTAVPSAPAASDRECCYLNVAELEASGTDTRWYTDPGLTTLAGTGSPFATGQTTAGVYTYYVTQTVNGCQSVSTTVSLTIFNSITFNAQPQPVTICPDGIAIFTVSASGSLPAYQWQEDGVNITDGGIYSGATTTVLTLTSPGITKNGKLYRCVVSTSCGTSPVNSSAAQLTIITDYTWTGTLNSDWNNTGNWICGIIPTQSNSVQIPDVSNKPLLSTGAVGTVNNLTIDPSSSLTIDGNTLQIAGAITNNGTFTASAGTIELNGSAAQTVPANTFAGNTIKNLTINNASGVTLLGILNVTDIVTVQSGTLASDGYLTLVSTAAQTALIDGSGAGTVTGNVIMQRYLPSGFGYKYFSSPFQSSEVSEFGDDMNLGASFPTFYRYDENRTSSGWVRYNYPDSLLKPLHGYAVNFGSNPAANTADVTGVVNNGSLSLTLYNHNYTYTQGFNLVGNPYPSPIDWDAASGWTKTNIDDALYYFKASAVDQYGGTYSTYINGETSDGLATNIIPSMQGVFIHVSDDAYPVTGTLAMDNNVRVTDLTHSFVKSGGTRSGNTLRFMAVFSGNPASEDPAVIYFDEKALEVFDSKLDALKLMNTDYTVPNLYAVSADGRKLSISGLPFIPDTLRTVPLGLKTNINGTVIFRILDIEGVFSEMKISIYDNVTGIEKILNRDNEYSVYLPYGEYQNRFFLNLSNISTGIPGDIYDADLINIYSSHGIIKAEINNLPGEEGVLSLYNLTGNILFVKDIYAPGYYEFNPPLNDGIYIVSYVSGTKRYIKKIFIKK